LFKLNFDKITHYDSTRNLSVADFEEFEAEVKK